MLFSPVTSEWGELLYFPTKPGEAFLTYGIAIMLVIGMIGLSLQNIRVSVKKLAYCTVCIAVATFLANISLSIGSAGGTITLFSMLLIVLPGFWYGPITGIAVGMAYGIFQMLIDPYLLFPTQVLVDYLLAFGALGFSGFFHNSKKGLIKGYILGVLGRYFFAFISGAVFFGDYAWEGWNPYLYSLAYNALYLFPEAIVTITLLDIPAVNRYMVRQKDFALEYLSLIKHVDAVASGESLSEGQAEPAADNKIYS